MEKSFKKEIQKNTIIKINLIIYKIKKDFFY